jgi:hypothetical protein
VSRSYRLAAATPLPPVGGERAPCARGRPDKGGAEQKSEYISEPRVVGALADLGRRCGLPWGRGAGDETPPT